MHIFETNKEYLVRVAEENGFGSFGENVDVGRHIFVGMGLSADQFHSHHMIAENNAHPVIFGCTGSNKTTAIIIPNILWRRRSFLAIDPKGEIASVVAPYLMACGFKVVVFDPYTTGRIESSSYDPVAILVNSDIELADKINQIVDALLVSTGGDSHWVDAAKGLLVGVIAFVVENECEEGSLLRVFEILQGGVGAIIEVAKKLIEEGTVGSLAFRKLSRYAELTSDNREAQSILSTLLVQMQFLDSEPIRNVLSGGTFRFEELLNLSQKVAVFVTLPPEKLESHNKFLRLMVTQAIATVSTFGGDPEDPVDLYVDEAGTIGHLPVLSQAVGLMRGRGLRVWTFFQTLSQLRRDYAYDYENFIGNSGTLILLKVMDNATAEYFSKKIGKTGWVPDEKNHLFNGKDGLKGIRNGYPRGGHNNAFEGVKDLLSPEELCQLPNDIGVILTDGAPALFVKAPYYKVTPFCKVTGYA